MRKHSHSLNLFIKAAILYKINSKVDKKFYHTNNYCYQYRNNNY